MLTELPRDYDRRSKYNAQGYKNSWSSYKQHIDTADCGMPVSVLLSSASMHDSLMDAGYCSSALREHSRSLGMCR